MEVKLLGPLGKVTGSCAWLRDQARGWSFLVDCGMQQGERTASNWNQGEWPFVPASIQFVVLTHAHIDHCGLLPLLYKQGFEGTVFCTRETQAFATILLKDAATLSKLYTAEDVDRIVWREHRSGPLLGGFLPVSDDLFIRYFRTGHVIGAVSVAIHWGGQGPGQRSIVFSGDLGPNREDQEYLPFIRHQMNVGPFDFAVIESTYGATVRPREQLNAQTRRDNLRRLLDRSLESGGSLLIPAFSFGRTQDVMFDLHWIVAEAPARYSKLNFYLDSPTAKRMHPAMVEALKRTESNGKHQKVRPLWLGKQMFRWLGLDDAQPDHIDALIAVCEMCLCDKRQQHARSKVGNDLARAWRPIFEHVSGKRDELLKRAGAPTVVVCGAGSCDGGPAQWWAHRLAAGSTNTIAFAGYCPTESAGGQILAAAGLPIRERQRHTGNISWPNGNTLPYRDIAAHVTKLPGYSAHADQAGLLAWVFSISPKTGQLYPVAKHLFIQHGNDNDRRALAAQIKQTSNHNKFDLEVSLPADPEKWFDLEIHDDSEELERRSLELRNKIQSIEAELALLVLN
ncbi:MBL fold metallo-hydrolase [Pseudomonas sp. GL-B-26]|uniref:MBL fold metallo-hydrolase n=1 Tax=Pseudomonas sp. GL-B-26 TaxID=2832394 RepID=UPI001CBC7266|nr:MBL fold metallo-hydrolase [Pseudomonas sp. GL-B-26]